MAQHARKLVEANGLTDIIEIIQSEMEKVELPVKVDIIVSEWMGYFLLRVCVESLRGKVVLENAFGNFYHINGVFLWAT